MSQVNCASNVCRFATEKKHSAFSVMWSQAHDARDWNQPVLARRLHATSIDPHAVQLDHLRDIVRGTVPSLQPVEDGTRTLIATLAVAEAAATGRRIDLADRYAVLCRA